MNILPVFSGITRWSSEVFVSCVGQSIAKREEFFWCQSTNCESFEVHAERFELRRTGEAQFEPIWVNSDHIISVSYTS